MKKLHLVSPSKSRPITYLKILVFGIISGLILIYITNAASNIAGDVNGDSKVDITDLSILLTNYGTSNSYGKGDLNESGRIDISDLSILLTHYGKIDVKPPSTSTALAMPAALRDLERQRIFMILLELMYVQFIREPPIIPIIQCFRGLMN